MLVSSVAVWLGERIKGDCRTAVPHKSGAPDVEKLVGFNVGSFHLFKDFVIISYVAMLIGGHRFTDAGIDAMGCTGARAFLNLFDRTFS